MKRAINGVLLLDKPVGPSSNEALQRVKALFGARKAGHTGSLDPNASGMLPICFGEATKFSQYLLDANKRYLVTGKLGETTASGDIETPILSRRPVVGIDTSSIKALLPRFRGEILQVPPMYSALKYHGQPLYKLARQGVEIDREARKVHVLQLELLDCTDGCFSLNLLCSKGTYVRTIVTDMGEALGCGAHVICLRRLAVGPYLADPMVTLQQIEELHAQGHLDELDKLLLPIDSMLFSLPKITLTDDMLYYLSLGNAVLSPKSLTVGLVRLYDSKDKFRGVGETLDNGKVAPRKIFLTG